MIPDNPEAEVARLAKITTRRLFVPGRRMLEYDDAYAVIYEGGWKAHMRFESSRGTWRTWVISGMRNAMREALRSFEYGASRNRNGVTAPNFESLDGLRGDDEGMSLEEAVADPCDYIAEKADELDRAVIMRAMRWLRERDTEVLNLYYREGLTFKQIAARFGISESRAWQLHASAIGRARMILQEEELYA